MRLQWPFYLTSPGYQGLGWALPVATSHWILPAEIFLLVLRLHFQEAEKLPMPHLSSRADGPESFLEELQACHSRTLLARCE